MIVTRKIELAVIADTPEIKADNWSYLRKLDQNIYLAANEIISDKWFHEAFTDKIIAPDIITIDKLKNEIEKLKSEFTGLKTTDSKIQKKIDNRYKQINKINSEARIKAQDELKRLYQTSIQNKSWQMTRQKYEFCTSYITDALTQKVNKDFINDLFDVKLGRRSTRTYRKGLPIPFRASAIKKLIEEPNGDHTFEWVNGIKFKLIYGRDRSSRRSEIENIIDGTYGYGDSAIQVKGKKLFLLLSLKHPDPVIQLDPEIAMEVKAGINIPVSFRVENKAGVFGDSNDILKFRTQMQSRYRNHQKRLKMTNGGKGRKKKLQKLEDFKLKEKNWIQTYNHKLSKLIIEEAKRCNAGTINFYQIKDGSMTEEQKKFAGRNWAGFQLKTMLEYKCKANNIAIYVSDYDPNE
jgi:transposase